MQKAARRIVEKLRLHGHEAYFAGGWVRDFLLGRKPQDIDIATSALPEEVIGLFPRAILIGAAFGVAQVRTYGRSFDVATFRSEGPYADGRHPSTVSFTVARQDAERRDFTINGLFYDPIGGTVIDYVGGEADLGKGIVRTIGEPHARFREDKLRMLRAVRFSCNLGFTIAAETRDAVLELAPGILQVSWERIRDELVKILTGPAPGRGLELLHETGLLVHILPEVEAMRGVAQPEEFHPEGDVFVHTCKALDFLRRPTPVLAVAALLHDVGKPPTFSVEDRIRFHGHVDAGERIAASICRRLRMSNEETGRVVELVHHHLRFMSIGEMRQSTLKRFIGLPHFADHLELHRADCLASHGNLDSYRFARKRHAALLKEPPPPPRLITGDDLVRLGVAPGPVFRQILRMVEDRQLESPGLTREEALDLVLGSYSPGKPRG